MAMTCRYVARHLMRGASLSADKPLQDVQVPASCCIVKAVLLYPFNAMLDHPLQALEMTHFGYHGGCCGCDRQILGSHSPLKDSKLAVHCCIHSHSTHVTELGCQPLQDVDVPLFRGLS